MLINNSIMIFYYFWLVYYMTSDAGTVFVYFFLIETHWIIFFLNI